MRFSLVPLVAILLASASVTVQAEGSVGLTSNSLGPRRLADLSTDGTSSSLERRRKNHHHKGDKKKKAHPGNKGSGGGGGGGNGLGIDLDIGGDVKTDGMLTWYDGNQLDNPACGGNTPSPEEHVVAVKSGGPFHCHQKIRIFNPDKGTSVDAKVIDFCESCEPTHIDAAPGVWHSLQLNMDLGVIQNLHYQVLG